MTVLFVPLAILLNFWGPIWSVTLGSMHPQVGVTHVVRLSAPLKRCPSGICHGIPDMDVGSIESSNKCPAYTTGAPGNPNGERKTIYKVTKP